MQRGIIKEKRKDDAAYAVCAVRTVGSYGFSDLYGCMGFGDAANGQHSWTLDEERSREIIKRGLDLGINFFDTAIGYQSGTSERYLGHALRDFAKREDVVVATKFLPRTPDEIEAGISGQQHIEQMVNTSLKNLGLSYVDLYIYHMWDYATPLYEIMEGLHRVVRQARSDILESQIALLISWRRRMHWRRRGFTRFISVQGHYNLIFREEEREMAKLCAEDQIAMTPYSALAAEDFLNTRMRRLSVFRRIATPDSSMMRRRNRMRSSFVAWRNWQIAAG